MFFTNTVFTTRQWRSHNFILPPEMSSFVLTMFYNRQHTGSRGRYDTM